MSPTATVGYLALFMGFGALFLLANLVVGWFVRPHAPNTEKLEIYECGEPTIGSSFVQFDLRFYVVALLFIIFDVEIAFFFPWAVVFGKSTQLMDPNFDPVQQVAAEGNDAASSARIPVQLSAPAARALEDLGVPRPSLPHANADAATNRQAMRDMARTLARTSLVDIGVFFAVLLVGFAYVWMRGDLDWVRAVGRRPSETVSMRSGESSEETRPPALVG